MFRKIIVAFLVLSGVLLSGCQTGQMQSQDQSLRQEQPERSETGVAGADQDADQQHGQQVPLQQHYGVSPPYDNQGDMRSRQRRIQVHSDDQPGESSDMTRDQYPF